MEPLSTGVKWPERQDDDSPKYIAEVNTCSYTSTPQTHFHGYVFMAWCLVKCRENLTSIYLMLFTLAHLGSISDEDKFFMRFFISRFLRRADPQNGNPTVCLIHEPSGINSSTK